MTNQRRRLHTLDVTQFVEPDESLTVPLAAAPPTLRHLRLAGALDVDFLLPPGDYLGWVAGGGWGRQPPAVLPALRRRVAELAGPGQAPPLLCPPSLPCPPALKQPRRRLPHCPASLAGT